MICKNCGAVYEDGSLRCPYCHSENVRVAENMKSEMLKSYDREAKNMEKNVSEEAVHRWTVYLIKGLIILLAVGILAAVAAVIWGRVSGGISHSGEAAHIKKLEAFCETGDYKALCEYVEKESLYGIKYQKYYEIKRVYRPFLSMENDIMQINRIMKDDSLTREEKADYAEYWVKTALFHASEALTYGRQYIDDNVFMDNEEMLKSICNECRRSVSELGLSEEETDMLEQENADYGEYLCGRILAVLLPEDSSDGGAR